MNEKAAGAGAHGGRTRRPILDWLWMTDEPER
jgi:hypothetical protein